MKCPHCAKPVAMDDESCPHCGVRMPTGRAEMGAETGCGLAAFFLLLLLIAMMFFGGWVMFGIF